MGVPTQATTNSNSCDSDATLLPPLASDIIPHQHLPLAGEPNEVNPYEHAALAMLPQWLRILSPSPWALVLQRHRDTPISSYDQQLRLGAAWAIAKLAETTSADLETSSLSELVRATLIHWQLGLFSDGRPRRSRDRRSDCVFVAAWYIVRMLDETAIDASKMLLDDLAKHLAWLSARSSASSWSQVAAIGAITGGGVLLRDSSLVTRGRRRLRALLDRQSEEGWFPEGGRFNLMKQTQTVGALCQLHHAYHWPELKEPLRHAVAFLANLAKRNGVANGLTSPVAGAFLFPCGFELHSAVSSNAARIAECSRGLAITIGRSKSRILSDEWAALAGGDIVTASAHCVHQVLPNEKEPTNVINSSIHRGARLATVRTANYYAVLTTTNGGAWQVCWKTPAKNLFDPPIAVVQANGRLVSPCPGGIITPSSEENRFEITGVFSPADQTASVKQRNQQPPGRDGFRRVLFFLDDEISVVDEVWCALPCRTILLQFAPNRSAANDLGALQTMRTAPLIIDGGRRVVVRRVYKLAELVQVRRQTGPTIDPH